MPPGGLLWLLLLLALAVDGVTPQRGCKTGPRGFSTVIEYTLSNSSCPIPGMVGISYTTCTDLDGDKHCTTGHDANIEHTPYFCEISNATQWLGLYTRVDALEGSHLINCSTLTGCAAYQSLATTADDHGAAIAANQAAIDALEDANLINCNTLTGCSAHQTLVTDIGSNGAQIATMRATNYTTCGNVSTCPAYQTLAGNVSSNGAAVAALQTEVAELKNGTCASILMGTNVTLVNAAGDYTTTSTSFTVVDASRLSIRLQTGARRVYLTFNGICSSLQTGNIELDVTMDGTSLATGSNNGLSTSPFVAGTSLEQNCGFTWLTQPLTAGIHTFQLRWRVSSGMTGTLQAQTATHLAHLSAFEVYSDTDSSDRCSNSLVRTTNCTLATVAPVVNSAVNTGNTVITATGATFQTVATVTTATTGAARHLFLFEGTVSSASAPVLTCRIASPAGTVLDQSARTYAGTSSDGQTLVVTAVASVASGATVVTECSAASGGGSVYTMRARSLRAIQLDRQAITNNGCVGGSGSVAESTYQFQVYDWSDQLASIAGVSIEFAQTVVMNGWTWVTPATPTTLVVPRTGLYSCSYEATVQAGTTARQLGMYVTVDGVPIPGSGRYLNSVAAAIVPVASSFKVNLEQGKTLQMRMTTNTNGAVVARITTLNFNGQLDVSRAGVSFGCGLVLNP